ncbi:M1 family metallopeptidase [Flagellimonas hymeniacidonis]|uniref:Aminopeptidase N n=1 Tax=Flagellimonas hymeniacidonis TaxID=2603628 RepID=A0A5C8V3G1_9FLAO|nr:M1 family metallopeptidase [Flagellimonas hymeniacidonis]TXN35582.1 M1 family metallopeptidase [Flagellimonas hymeniacidonis]
MKLSPIAIFFLFAQILASQIQDKVDFIRAEVFVEPIPEEKQINGRVQYEFQVLKDVDSVFLDAVNIDFSSVLLGAEKVKYTNDGKTVSIRKKLKKGDTHFLDLSYQTKPKQTVYFLGWEDDNPFNNQIWTQGQGKYTSHWLPSFDDMTEKVEFDLSISFNKEYEVFANGALVDRNESIWKFDSQKPMSSYLVAFAIGNFKKENITSTSKIPIELYYEPKDSLKVEPTYRYSQRIFDFLEKEIGIPYPWQNYKQIPVQDFLYAGMENTGATIFSNTFMVDSIAFLDKNYVNVNAHEMAHQWFGNLVTEQSGEHHWLHEGFATYYAYLAEKDIFGEDYFYWRLLETARALNNFSGDGNGEALTNSSAGSLTFYEKGAWALVMLKERVGESNFKTGIQHYLDKYAYQNVTIADFMWEMEKASGMKLTDFEESWLQESEFPFEDAKKFLSDKNMYIYIYFDIKNKIGTQKSQVETILKKEWDSFNSEQLKHQLLLDYGNQLSPEFIKEILNTENVKVRQGLVISLTKISKELKGDFEVLLMDKSYKTIEAILYRLWTDFPENQKLYLDKTSNIIGLPNKNVRLLWLTLALVSPEYHSNLKPKYFEELSGYTGSEYHFEVRLLAFQYLKNIGAFSDETLKNLLKACNHHVWHFKKSSRKILKEFLKGEGSIARLKAIYPTLKQEQQQYLDKALGK